MTGGRRSSTLPGFVPLAFTEPAIDTWPYRLGPQESERLFLPLLVSALPDWTHPLASAADVLRPALAGAPLPGALVEAVLAAGEPAQLGLLAANQRLLSDRPDLRDRLAATGCAPVARVILGLGHARETAWPLRARRRVLDCAGGAGWAGPEGVATALLAMSDPGLLRAAVGCPVAGVARGVLVAVGGGLTRAEQLRGLLTVHDHDGGPAALRLLDGASWLRPVVAEVVRDVLATGDAGALRKAAEVAEGTDGLVEELLDTGSAEREELLGLRDEVDWALVAAWTEAFDEVAAGALVARADCPGWARDELYRVHGVAVAERAARVDVGMFAVAPGGARAAKAVGVVARRVLDEGPGDSAVVAVLEAARPAVAVLEALRQPSGGAGPVWASLASLVAERLGEDVEAWRAVRARLPRFAGTVAELLHQAPPAGKQAGGWPGGSAMPESERSTTVTGARSAFLTLLDAAPAHDALLPHLDGRTVCDLFGHGRWRPEWIDLALSSPDPRHLRVLTNRGSLPAAAIDVLMRLDDPAVNARLFVRTAATAPQRERLLSGRPFNAPGPLPLDPEMVKELSRRAAGWRGRDAVDCADLELQRHILRHVRVRGIVPQLRMMLNLWERHGADQVTNLLDDEPQAIAHTRKVIRREVRAYLTKLLAGRDREAALAKLRARVTEGETVQWQIAALREQDHSGNELFKEAQLWHWADLMAEHARDPLPGVALNGLAKIPECPDELRAQAALHGYDQAPREVLDALAAGTTPRELLRGGSIDYDVVTWVHQATKTGQLTWDEVLESARPALRVLMLWGGERLRDPLTSLVRACLDPAPEAWVLALRMLPDFTGSVAELLRTAATATGVVLAHGTE
ncbi:hypothetical protein FXF51_55555 [Nonomuraea sp. PA05]|uniref:hypothetical protein n=1 Tax=Nonomuraea sp. PA05 TaxID=2604466 RepID=UPI0011D81A58|nr:hypothetical protein [Nonomuraea sp. PA05]TYB50615.1 hypothetical protein FXF51_55555 [Nonomuraea sp. PA05]